MFDGTLVTAGIQVEETSQTAVRLVVVEVKEVPVSSIYIPRVQREKKIWCKSFINIELFSDISVNIPGLGFTYCPIISKGYKQVRANICFL